MEFLLDPSIWAGLLTLIMLEIVLSIDNLVFLAILADKLPPKERDKARLIGLSLALIMRLSLLSIISWMVTLTRPLFSIGYFEFSGKDLILLVSGFFLLCKATIELHERLENNTIEHQANKNSPSFLAMVIQIVLMDVVFSLDAVITAVGMVNQLPIMMTSVVIATAIMQLASKPLTRFINAHPTVVVLCLSFLLMIGLSLIAEGFGFYIPKAYLYVAIGFSIFIELFNQIARRNFLRHQQHRPIRERTAEAIIRLMGGLQKNQPATTEETTRLVETVRQQEAFKDEERYMINSVLTLSQRSISSIMTPRSNISWIDVSCSLNEIRTKLLDTSHSLFPVCRGELDKIIGVIRAKELLVEIDKGTDVAKFASNFPAVMVLETLDSINLLGVLRRAKDSFVIIINKFGIIQGLITPLDVLEVIAGEFLDEKEKKSFIS
ncbi:hypothetical protein FD728_01235 [Pantoea sp. Aalb]|nr:hypothetical protein [Pantoea sp. Aalb]